ncbi:hypothetical protein Dsin_020596 [Dipteronia sinensis]|uniref:Uncharacterized protein n=1 Tax=Dipteronia sinensis TaxID=43782 RepID=A0AAE0A9I9_9ROSI|nr:hypothetical protein Dsin_020596 [Dipteronia sinensis]
MNYLTPLDFYTKIFKDILMNEDSKHGRLLGLDVYENYVSLAVSDPNNLIAVPLRNLDSREHNISSRVADIILSLIPEYNLVGIVVGTNYFGYYSRPFVSLYIMIFFKIISYLLSGVIMLFSFYLIRIYQRGFLSTTYAKQEKLKAYSIHFGIVVLHQ